MGAQRARAGSRRVNRERLDGSWLRAMLVPALLIAAAVATAVYALDLIPPKSLTFAAGRPGGGFHAMAERYRAILARDGVELIVLDTPGSVENAELLAAGEADAGFLQGGINPPPDAGIEALAAVFLEPLWLFHTGALADPSNPLNWRDRRIAAGEIGGGTRYVVEEIVAALGLAPGEAELIPLGGADAAGALLAGDVDAALFVAPADAPYLEELFDGREVLGTLRDGEALARRLPYVQVVEIPRSAIDYAAQIPARPIELIAMVGRLAARGDLHPALVDRLVSAAREVHSPRGLFNDENAFPRAAGAALPLNVQAADLLEKGPNPLARFLPYWVVAQISSFALLLVPILFLLVPLVRMGPTLYQWRMNSRVWRHYGELLDIDREMLTAREPGRLRALEGRLDAIEADLIDLRLPLRFRERAYTMRMHINLVRGRIRELLVG